MATTESLGSLVPPAADVEHLVGVLGGMGPAATADFYTKLISHTPAARDQDHLRVVIWADPTVPDRVAAIAGSVDLYPKLHAGARFLGDAGATIIAMPCHTAHAFLPRLIADTGLHFLDIIAETVAALGPDVEAGRVTLLGTRGLLRTGLYQGQLDRARIPTVLADEVMQRQIDVVIEDVKAGRHQRAGGRLDPVLRALADSGASRVVLACTELPLAVPFAEVPDGLLVLDPTDVLARAVLRACGRRPRDQEPEPVALSQAKAAKVDGRSDLRR